MTEYHPSTRVKLEYATDAEFTETEFNHQIYSLFEKDCYKGTAIMGIGLHAKLQRFDRMHLRSILLDDGRRASGYLSNSGLEIKCIPDAFYEPNVMTLMAYIKERKRCPHCKELLDIESKD